MGNIVEKCKIKVRPLFAHEMARFIKFTEYWICDDERIQKFRESCPVSKNDNEQYWLEAFNDDDQLFYVVQRDDQLESFIGVVKFDAMVSRLDYSIFELSYWLVPDYWKQGIGIEMVQKGLVGIQKQYHNFNNEAWASCLAKVRKNNMASIKILNRLGFQCIGEDERLYFYRLPLKGG